jgi:asparagine synthase (glutamine-hydrolysing)
MCGIAGIVELDGGPIARERLEAMGASLAHRGPDAQGVFVDCQAAPSVGLVHRRLSVIDLDRRADQPLANEDGTVQVLLNGEIYNFRELRAALEARHQVRTAGDTEAVVHGYEERGDEIVSALDGMFALAIWDGRARRLVLARDPFGKKPLYYAVQGRQLVFGSEIKAILAAGFPSAMGHESLAEYLAFGYVPTPRTLFRGIEKLAPGSILVVDASGVRPATRYWSLEFPAAGEARSVSMREAAARVRELLTEAVRKRLVADVPLGVLLSGGVDSSAVAALVARLVPGRVKTFTVGFEGHSFYDERAFAERVARHVGSDHHASVVAPHAASLVETLLHHHDEPFGDSSALPTYLVAQEARRHVTVALNGDGGDETFAGYDRFQAALIADRIPAPGRHALRWAGRLLPEGGSYYGTLRRIRRFTSKAALPFVERIFAWHVFFDLEALGRIALPGVVARERVLSSYREALSAFPASTLLSRLLSLNVRTYLLDDLLPKMDRMSMAHALETRSPLLDRAVVEYAATLPDHLKRAGSQGKLVLKEAIRDLVPREVLTRRKHGFGVPLGDWFRGELRPMVEDTLLAGSRLGRFLDHEEIRRIHEEHVSGGADRGHQLWTLLTLELWLRKHRFA